MKNEILEILKRKDSSPFLFVGSGFSRRYTGLENWKELLERFSEGLRPFEYYISTANQNLPLAASYIAQDYHEAFWTNPKFETQRKKNQKRIINQSSAIKIAISNYLMALSNIGLQNQEFAEEIKLLNKLNVDGIITTNWDTLLEELLPDYKVFIGQDELLFSNPQSIGEIYKIHGCISLPESLILTAEDYESYNSRNAYLAAKLITLFIEHPIIFIGYSLTDSNIREILTSIVRCLGKDKINELHNNLIFVQRTKNDEKANIYQSFLVIDETQLPITVIKSKSYIPVYEAIDSIKRKIPIRVLRHCKEQIFELVNSQEPDRKLCVVDFDSIEDKSNIEFVIGIGVINKHLSSTGYQSIKPIDLFHDLIYKDSKFNSQQILEITIPDLQGFLPIYKHLNKLGITSSQQYKQSKFNVDDRLKKAVDFQSAQNRKSYLNHAFNQSVSDIIKNFPSNKAMIYLPFATFKKEDVEILCQFLKDHFDDYWNTIDCNRTFYRKLACYYDYLRYGWN